MNRILTIEKHTRGYLSDLLYIIKYNVEHLHNSHSNYAVLAVETNLDTESTTLHYTNNSNCYNNNNNSRSLSTTGTNSTSKCDNRL